MPNSSQTRRRRQRTPYAWIGVGALGAGVCWAALAGAGVAAADNQVDSNPGRHAATASTASAAHGSPARRVAHASTARSVKPSAARRVTLKAATSGPSAPRASVASAAPASAASASTSDPKPAPGRGGRGYEYRALPTVCIVYTANAGDNTVTVVDPARGTVTATISVGKRPLDILAINDAIYVSTDDGFTAYGTQQGSVKVINAFNNRITASIPIGPLGFNMASSRTGGKVYVTNALGGSVSAIDKAINTVADIIPVDGNYLGPLVVNSDGTRLYATSGLANGGALTKINTVSLISAQFDVGLVPYALGISPNGTRLYATFNNGQAGGVLRVINVSDLTTIADIPVGHDPISAAVSPDGTRVYVANYRDGTLSVVDVSSSTVTATIPVGSRPTDVALSLDGKFVYVTDSSDNTVRVIRAINNKVVETITVGPNPGAIAVA